jgi:hypothetical protein
MVRTRQVLQVSKPHGIEGRNVIALMEREDVMSPMQLLFLKSYLDVTSPTFADSRKSALAAGYSEKQSEDFVHRLPSFVKNALDESGLLTKAIRNIEHFLDYDADPKIQADMTKFVATTLGKHRFNTRIEVDISSGGQPITGINYILPGQALPMSVANEMEE